jgi:phytoene synthase
VDGAAGELDEQLRRADPDRWLTSRFIADPAARADVAALYLFDHELARARRAASTALLAEIRLTWWREALDEMFAEGPPRHHPVAEALAAAVRRHGLPRAPLEAMIDAQIAALDEAVLDGPAALAWADAVEGSVARLAAMVLDADGPADAASAAGRAWGLALLLRAGLAARDTVGPLLREALIQARSSARRLGVKALPAALPARLARFDLAGRKAGPIAKQFGLIVSAASGRV